MISSVIISARNCSDLKDRSDKGNDHGFCKKFFLPEKAMISFNIRIISLSPLCHVADTQIGIPHLAVQRAVYFNCSWVPCTSI